MCRARWPCYGGGGAVLPRDRDNKTWDEWVIYSKKIKAREMGWLRDEGEWLLYHRISLYPFNHEDACERTHLARPPHPPTPNPLLAIISISLYFIPVEELVDWWQRCMQKPPHSEAVKMIWIWSLAEGGGEVCTVGSSCAVTYTHTDTQQQNKTKKWATHFHATI